MNDKFYSFPLLVLWLLAGEINEQFNARWQVVDPLALVQADKILNPRQVKKAKLQMARLPSSNG